MQIAEIAIGEVLVAQHAERGARGIDPIGQPAAA
jgi:hypothetical protein